MLRERIITAIILLAIIISSVLLMNRLVFGICSAAVLSVAMWEWAQLVGLNKFSAKLIYVLLFYGVIAALLMVNLLYTLIAAQGLLLLLIFDVYRYAKDRALLCLSTEPSRAIVGVLLFVFCWYGLNTLYASENSHFWVLYAMSLVICVDTAGYFIGKRYGQRLLCPRVSPNKTWEGLIAGLVTSVPLTLIGAWCLHLSWCAILFLWAGSLIVQIVAAYGDLIESLVKRQVGAKDSGRLLPGHGGVLDRIDGLLTSTSLMALVMWAMVTFFK